jgi:hypothetical protein
MPRKSQRTPEERKAQKAAYWAKYYARHKERLNTQTRAWRAANASHCQAYDATYRQEHLAQVRAKDHRYHTTHAEHYRALRRAHYAAHREEQIARAKAWAEAHPEQRRTTRRLYHAMHKAQVAARHQAWFKANPDKNRAYVKSHKARKKNAPVCDLTAAQWEEIKIAYSHCCVYCGRQMQRLTQDHLTPLSKGGSHTKHNVVPACLSCNSKKKTGPVLKPVQPLLL